MPRGMLDESRELTHRRLTPPACRRAVPRAGRGGRADQQEPAFAAIQVLPARPSGDRDRRVAGQVGCSGVLSGGGCWGCDYPRPTRRRATAPPRVANPYHYTNNDPVNLTDPTGLRTKDCNLKSEADGRCVYVLNDMWGPLGGDKYRQGEPVGQNWGELNLCGSTAIGPYCTENYAFGIYQSALQLQLRHTVGARRVRHGDVGPEVAGPVVGFGSADLWIRSKVVSSRPVEHQL